MASCYWCYYHILLHLLRTTLRCDSEFWKALRSRDVSCQMLKLITVLSVCEYYLPGQEKEKESQWAVLRSWEIWVWEFLSEFKVSSSSEIPDSDLRPASSFISVLLILHLPRTRHENKSCSILRSRCLIGWIRHKNTHNSWFGVFLRGFNISEVVLCVCFLLFEKKMSLADCVNCLCLHPAAAFCLHQLTLSLLSDLVWPPGLWLFMCRVIGPIRPAGQPRFKSISVHCEFTGAFTRPFTSTSGSTPLTRTKLKLKNMLVVPVSLLSFLSVTFCVSLPTLCINIRSERCEDPIAQTTLDHLSEVVWPACDHIHQSDLYVVHCDVNYVFVLSQPAKVRSRCLWTLF